jgi:CheY-like chemotaxis protein
MKRSVLIVEDNETNLYLLRYLLEQSGMMVYEARDGIMGIEVASRTCPDCILLDVQLPQMCGYDVARALRADPKLRATPIIVMTGNARAEDYDEAMAAGATDFIEKPVDPETLLAQISKYLTAAA